jgi:hypothetical protein
MSGLITMPSGAGELALAQSTKMTPEQIQDCIGPWLARLQLFSSRSGPVMERVISAGHWGIPVSSSTIIDLGEEVDVVLVAHRDRAMWYDGEEMHSSTDRSSPLFNRLKDMAEADSESGAMYGPEFLAWVGEIQMFLTVFLGSKSARRETLAFMQVINQPAVVYSKLVGKKHRWEVPLIKSTKAFPFDLPTEKAVKDAWEKFTKPDEQAEIVDANDSDGSRER